jgi:hypothetical protein
MVEVFYKPDYKVYIFKGEDMHNEELISALDNSPTYSRTAQDLERIAAIIPTGMAEAENTVEEKDENQEQEEIL